MKTIIKTIGAFALLLTITINGQIVNIPNSNFKNALLQHGGSISGNGIGVIDTNGDGEIQQSEAVSYTGKIRIIQKGINDLTGIEAFTNIIGLYCGFNQLTSLNVTNNTKLVELDFYQNQVSTLDVSQNTALKFLELRYNSLTSLNVSSNVLLEHLGCTGNQLTSLDVSNNPNLIELRVASNQLVGLNIANGNNENLDTLLAYGNGSLTCIQYDAGFDPNTKPANYNTLKGWFKPSGAEWSESCNLGTLDIDFIESAIYPNPTRSILYIKTRAQLTSLALYDTSGRLVKKFQPSARELNLSSFNKGVYFLDMSDGVNYISHKVIKN